MAPMKNTNPVLQKEWQTLGQQDKNSYPYKNHYLQPFQHNTHTFPFQQ